MDNTSVREIPRLPLFGKITHPNVARDLLLRLLRNLKVGTLTIHDKGEVIELGHDTDPSAPHAEVTVNNSRLYWRVLTGGTIGSGEAYIDGDWSSRNLTEVTRLFCANLPTMEAMRGK